MAAESVGDLPQKAVNSPTSKCKLWNQSTSIAASLLMMASSAATICGRHSHERSFVNSCLSQNNHAHFFTVVFETHLSPYTAFIMWWMWTYQHHSDARNWITTHRCITDGSGITLTMYTICSRTFACDDNKLLFVHWPVLITLAVTSSYYRALAHIMSHGQISFHHILQYC